MEALPDLIREAAKARPGAPALIFHDRVTTYADLDRLVDRTAAALYGLGIGRGDRVAILLANIPEFVHALHGALRLGSVAMPLNPMLTPDELASLLLDAEASAIVVGIDLVPAVRAARGRVPSLEHVLVVGPPPTPAGTRSFDAALDAAGDPPPVDVARGDLAVLAYTAGTTDEPKGAMLTHGNLLANVEQLRAVPALRASSSDVALIALPLFHEDALNAALGTVLMEGATAVLVDRLHPARTLDLVRRHGVTILFGTPQMFHAWLGAARRIDVDLSSVRLAVSGAAALPPTVLEGFRERFGCTIWDGYGLTETAPVVTTNALGEVTKPDSIGLPLPGVEVRILGEDGAEVVDGDPGEIVVRGPNVFKGYWGRPEESDAVLDRGWFRTGDIAYRDEDGSLFLVDRSKDVINVSGFHVYPREVEEVLLAHPAVGEAGVVGVPDDRSREAVRAFVVRTGEVSTEELREHCRRRLARFKLPRDIDFVDALPSHATEGVARRRFRA